MLRDQIESKYKWDLRPVFSTDEEWERAYERFRGEYESIGAFKGRLTESAQTLLNYRKEVERLSRELHKIYVYAHLRFDENTKDGKTQDMNSRVRALVAQFQETVSFFEPEILSADPAVLSKLVGAQELSLYRHFFEDLLRRKPYTLSVEMENLLAKTAELASAPSSAFSMLNNADMTFEDALDSEGVAHKVSNGSYRVLIQSKDRTLRKNAFESIHKSFKNHVNTLASLMQSEVKKNIFNAKARGYASAREAALFENNVPVSVPDKLIEAVHANLDKNHRAMAIRKRMLGVDELHLYDTYVSLADDIEFKFTYEEACEIVLEAFKPLGSDYVEAVRKGLRSGWVDVYENEGKRSGAYSSGCYDTPPYVLLNFHGTLDDVFTLAHELGHSMHSYLTRSTQPSVYGDYSIFVAEVASTTNEALLNHYLLKQETDPSKRKYILSHFIDGLRATVIRQTMFAEFERDIHAHVEAGGSLTADYLCEHYIGLVRKYFGEEVVIDDLIRYEWARIPHFYYNFYVYQYATGYSAAVSLSKDVLEGRTADYLAFLSAGSSDYPIEVLRRAGADMESDAPVSGALGVLGEVLNDFDRFG